MTPAKSHNDVYIRSGVLELLTGKKENISLLDLGPNSDPK